MGAGSQVSLIKKCKNQEKTQGQKQTCMKKTFLINTGAGFFILLLFCCMSSCRKDGLNSKELLIFLQGDIAGKATSTQTVPFLHNPIQIIGNTMIDVSAYATREVPADIEVSIYPHPDAVNEYNQKYNTNHLTLPTNTYRVVNGYKHKILAGTLQSDPLQIEITHPELLTDPLGYLLPLFISEIESQDKGARISTTHSTMYLLITYEFNNIQNTETPVSGSMMTRTGWSVSVSNFTSGAGANLILDGNNGTRWRSSNSSSAEKWVILDMGSLQQQVQAILMTPTYTTTSENVTGLNLSTSVDNVNWKEQGSWEGTGPASGTSANNPDIKGINFIAPVTARYFRIDITTMLSGTSRAAIAELNAIQ